MLPAISRCSTSLTRWWLLIKLTAIFIWRCRRGSRLSVSQTVTVLTIHRVIVTSLGSVTGDRTQTVLLRCRSQSWIVIVRRPFIKDLWLLSTIRRRVIPRTFRRIITLKTPLLFGRQSVFLIVFVFLTKWGNQLQTRLRLFGRDWFSSFLFQRSILVLTTFPRIITLSVGNGSVTSHRWTLAGGTRTEIHPRFQKLFSQWSVSNRCLLSKPRSIRTGIIVSVKFMSFQSTVGVGVT